MRRAFRAADVGGDASRSGVVLACAILACIFTISCSSSPAGASTRSPASAKHNQPGHHQAFGEAADYPSAIAPPKPPTSRPTLPVWYRSPTALVSSKSSRATSITSAKVEATSIDASTASSAAPSPPSQAVTWGSGPKSTLVLYDTTGTYGFLGQEYAMMAGNLASHFGTVTAEPVVDYETGQIAGYSATIYLGSTYNQKMPATFLNNVLSATTPVMWLGDNIWELSGTEGTAADKAFEAKYGWDPSTSYFDSESTIGSVTYNGETLTRNLLDGEVLSPHITTSALVTQLAEANCESSSGVSEACGEITQAPGGTSATSFPWAIESQNLYYIGEIPFSYVNQTDRYIALSGLLYNLLDPGAAPSHLGLVRFEDLNPYDTSTLLVEAATYLHSIGVPFSMGIISWYKDPCGYYTNGVPVTIPMDGTTTSATKFVAAIKQMMSLGGTLILEGLTHQYSAPGLAAGKCTHDPISGVTGDDFEFEKTQCSSTATPPYHFLTTTGKYTATHGIYTTTCTTTSHVIYEGPEPTDSTPSWALDRLEDAFDQFHGVGLPAPKLTFFPHYAGSARDYHDVTGLFPGPTGAAYTERIYYDGLLTGGGSVDITKADYTRPVGQLFPYTVHDLYGETVLPEDLGTYEATEDYGQPARSAADLVAEAKDELAVQQGFASFFYHPNTDPLTVLKTTVPQMEALGYTFVSPTSLIQASATSAEPTMYVKTFMLANGKVGTAYSETLTAGGGSGSNTWAVTSGALPAGLTLGRTTGAITGTPTTAGASTFVVTTTDSAGDVASTSLSITVTTSSFTVTTSSLPAGMVGLAYSTELASSGGTGNVTWTVTSGALPAGLTLGRTTGAITGTPTTATTGTSVTFEATDSASPADTATATLTLTVDAALTITTTSLPTGTAQTAYSATLAASGGIGAHTWSITTGALPAGLSLNKTTGAITGTPTAASTTTLGFTVTDSASPADTATKSLTLTVTVAALTITTTSLPKGTAGKSYSATLAASGGITPYKWSVSSGALPAGLALNKTTGAITGTPTGASAGNIGFKVTDSNSPADTATKTLLLQIVANTITITTTSLPKGTAGTAYSATLAASGGITPYKWTVTSGALPAGLSLNATTGAITGTPTGASKNSITFTVTDSASPADTASKSLTLTVSGVAISITTSSLPSGRVGTAYSATLTASGGLGAHTWSISSGTLPAGLSLNATTGAITGTPTATYSTSVTFEVADSAVPPDTATKKIKIQIRSAPAAVQMLQSIMAGRKE